MDVTSAYLASASKFPAFMEAIQKRPTPNPSRALGQPLRALLLGCGSGSGAVRRCDKSRDLTG